MSWVNTAGIIGSFLFLIKIMIHLFVKRKVGKKFYIGAIWAFLKPLKPVMKIKKMIFLISLLICNNCKPKKLYYSLGIPLCLLINC